MIDSEKPVLSERDLSYNVALAGREALEAASAAGGEPAALRSLVAAAALDPAPPARGASLRGRTLHQDDLVVTLCLSLHDSLFGGDVRQAVGSLIASASAPAAAAAANSAEHMRAVAALAFIFTDPHEAWELLDSAPPGDEDGRQYARRAFCRAALEFAGDFGPAEMTILVAHLARLARRVPDRQADDGPGKPQAPAR